MSIERHYFIHSFWVDMNRAIDALIHKGKSYWQSDVVQRWAGSEARYDTGLLAANIALLKIKHLSWLDFLYLKYFGRTQVEFTKNDEEEDNSTRVDKTELIDLS
ncbi:MAG: hypothetical protein DDT19_02289 [Syntrophomonadaceae bacterium]|nr:hypothetical protein [Bacillota bacterium]